MYTYCNIPLSMQTDLNVVQTCALKEGRIYSYILIFICLILFLYFIYNLKKQINNLTLSSLNLPIIILCFTCTFIWILTPKVFKNLKTSTFKENEIIIANLLNNNMNVNEARKQLIQYRQSEKEISALNRQRSAINRNTLALLTRRF